MELKIIQHGSDEYDQMVRLRMEILRIPLGLSFTREQLEKEKGDILIGAFENKEMMGCCVLTPHDSSTIQLRQMAVKKDTQARGVGRNMLEYAEQTALEKGYSIMMMHARNIALGFYQKCGYKVKGDEFIEVSIPHHQMEKRLNPKPLKGL